MRSSAWTIWARLAVVTATFRLDSLQARAHARQSALLIGWRRLVVCSKRDCEQLAREEIASSRLLLCAFRRMRSRSRWLAADGGELRYACLKWAWSRWSRHAHALRLTATQCYLERARVLQAACACWAFWAAQCHELKDAVAFVDSRWSRTSALAAIHTWQAAAATRHQCMLLHARADWQRIRVDGPAALEAISHAARRGRASRALYCMADVVSCPRFPRKARARREQLYVRSAWQRWSKFTERRARFSAWRHAMLSTRPRRQRQRQ